MDALRHLQLMFEGISGRIKSYTDDPEIISCVNQIKLCADNGDREEVLCCLKNLLAWYEDEMENIRCGDYGFDAHRANKKSIENLIHEIEVEEENHSETKTVINQTLVTIFERFHLVYRQLQRRHDNRSTLVIQDEYDVQDLLHSLLTLFFDDVRPEEAGPSFAGASSRMDFFLKDCRTVIEVKKTRPTMPANRLGEELIGDRDKYKKHPDCDALYCFVYDPDHLLPNPIGIIHDLEEGSMGFMRVFIEPR